MQRAFFYGAGLIVLFGFSACSSPVSPNSLSVFQGHLQTLCGQKFNGTVTSTDPQDEGWRKEVLTVGPVTCPDDATTILPLAVGPDHSRVWTLQLQDDGQILDFRHAHTLKNGRPDPVTGYGGVATNDNSSSVRAVFPVDALSKKVFAENDLQASMTNVWMIEIDPDKRMTYSLTREGRSFIAEFDLTPVK